jgi:hypothetical protein
LGFAAQAYEIDQCRSPGSMIAQCGQLRRSSQPGWTKARKLVVIRATALNASRETIVGDGPLVPLRDRA